MSYTVLCGSAAEEQLAAAYLESGDRHAVTAASRDIGFHSQQSRFATAISRGIIPDTAECPIRVAVLTTTRSACSHRGVLIRCTVTIF